MTLGFLLNLQGTRISADAAQVEEDTVPTSTFSYFFCRDYSHYSVWVGCKEPIQPDESGQ
jgi:hypothetical protein